MMYDANGWYAILYEYAFDHFPAHSPLYISVYFIYYNFFPYIL